MDKQDNSTNTEQMMEAYYKYIGEAHIENIVSELDGQSANIDKVKIPKSLDDWFKGYVEKGKKEERQKKLMRRIKKVSSRVAIVLICLIISMIVITFTVEAVRVKVFNFWSITKEKYTEIRVDEASSDHIVSNSGWENYYYPSYIPNGYSLESNEEFGTNRILKFSDGKEQFSFMQAKNGTDFQLDTEEAITEEIMIDGYKGLLILKDGRVLLFWNNAESSFYLNGYLESETFIEMAESLEKK